MATYNSKYFLTAAAGKVGFLDLRLQAGALTLNEQIATVMGSAQVDYLYASKNLSVDFTTSGAGADRLYLDGALSDYTFVTAGSVLTLTHKTTGSTYKINTGEDLLVFSNGNATAAAVSAGQAGTALATTFNSLTAPDMAAVGAPVTTGNPTATATTSLQTAGTVVAAANPVLLKVSGSAGVDTVYVKAGSNVDATALGGSMDKIYLTGKWADYTKTVSGTMLTLSRTVNGVQEKAVVSAGAGVLNDKLFFIDGNVTSQKAAAAIKANPAATLGAAGGTVVAPGTGSEANQTPLVALADTVITAISADTANPTDAITKTPAQTITGTYTGTLDTGDKIQVKINGAWVDAVATPTSTTGGTFSVDGILPEGLKTLEVQVLGAGGNTKAGTGKDVTLDTDVPTAAPLTVKSGQDANVNAAEPSVTVSVPTADLKVGDTVELKVAGVPFAPPVTTTVTQAMLDAGSVELVVPKAGLAEGANTITVTTSDVAGNTSDNLGTSLTLTLDTSTPTPSIAIAPTKADGGAWATPTINDAYLNATETEEVFKVSGGAIGDKKNFKEGDKVQLLKDGIAIGAERTVTADEAAANAVYFTVAKADIGSTNGAYTFTAKATDAAGNSATSADNAVVHLDNHAPVPELTVSTTDADGTTPRTGEQIDQFLNAAEPNILLKVEGITGVTDGTFKAGDVVTLQYEDTDGSIKDVVKKGVDGAPDSTYTATVGTDGAPVYFDVAKSDLKSGDNTLQAKAVDLAGNSGNSGQLLLKVVADITITNTDMLADNVLQLEVISQIVLTASQALNAATPGKYIRIVNDANTASKAGFEETTTNSFTIEASDARYVTIVGDKIIIKPPFDFDFSNNYHVEIDAGAFTAVQTINGNSITQGNSVVDNATGLKFSTVDLGTSKDTAVQGQRMDDTGTLVNGKKWFEIEGEGTLAEAAAAIDLNGADYAMVFRDQTATGAQPSVNDGVGVGAPFNVQVNNFEAGDLIYADDQANDKTQLNNTQFTQITSDGTQLSVNFDSDGVLGADISTIKLVTSTLDETAVRSNGLNISNTKLGITDLVASYGITYSGSATLPDNLISGKTNASFGTIQLKVASANLKAGDSVQFVYLDADGVEQNLGAAVTVDGTQAAAQLVSTTVADTAFAGLAQGPNNSIYAKVTGADGAVSRSTIINGTEGIAYDSVAPAPVLTVKTGEDATLIDTEPTINVVVEGGSLSVGDKITLNGLKAGVTAPVRVVTEDDVVNGATFTVNKTDLVAGANNLTATVADQAGYSGTSGPLVVTVNEYVIVSGGIGAGPVIAGNDLKVSVYNAAGVLLASDTTVDATTGAFSLQVLKNAGPIVLKVTSTAAGKDYMDEATVAQTDLAANTLMAVQNIAASDVTININPLTDLAARQLTTAGTLKAGTTATAITAANTAISKAFIDPASTADITTLVPAFTVNTAGTSTAGAANAVGQVLAALSTQAKTAGVDAAQAAVAASLTWSGDNATATQNANGVAAQVSALAKVATAVAAAGNGTGALSAADLAPLSLTGLDALSAERKTALLADIGATPDAGTGVQTAAQLQALVDKQIAIAKIDKFAEDGTTAPTLEDYIAAGYTGVTAANLAAVNAKLDANNALANGASDTQVKALIDAGIAAQTTALAKITAYAAAATPPAANTAPVPTLQDYIDAGVNTGTGGVNAANLDAVNRAVDAAAGSSDAGTIAQVNALIAAGDANYTAAVAALRNHQIDSVANAAPTLANYLDAGVAGATAANKTLLDDALLNSAPKAPAATDAAILTALDALAKISAYASDNTKPAPTLQDYIDAGVTGVDASNLSAVNAKVDQVLAADANTKAEIQALVTEATAAPSILSITSSTSDGLYGIGKTIALSVTVSKDIATTDATLALTLETGATDEVVTLTRDATNHKLFTGNYIVKEGNESADLAVKSVAVGTVEPKDAGGNTLVTTTLPTAANSLEGSKALVIDGVRPNLEYPLDDQPGNYVVEMVDVVAASVLPTARFVDPTFDKAYLVKTGGTSPINLVGEASITSAPSSQWKVLTTANGLITEYTGPDDLATNGVTFAGLEDGIYNIIAVDKAGNISNNLDWDDTYRLDTTAPTPTLVSTGSFQNTANAVVKSTETGTAYLVKTTGTGAITVTNEASITGAADAVWNTVSIGTANTNTNLSLAGLGDGTYSLYVKDALGNFSSAASSTIVVDTTAPTATLVSTGSLQNTANAVVKSTETGTAYLVKTTGTGAITVTNEASITGAADAVWNTVSIGTANTNTNLSLAGLGDGTYSLYVKDALGNFSSAASSTIVVDTTAPTPTLVSTGSLQNTANAVVKSTETGTAYLVKTTGTGAITVTNEASITGAADAVWNTVSIGTANTNTNLSLAGLGDGTYSLYVKDALGNFSSAASSTIVVDTTAPTATANTKALWSDATYTGGSVTNNGDKVLVKSTEAGGTAYIVDSASSVTTVAQILALADNKYNSVALSATANTDTDLTTNTLLAGTYKVYVADALGNLSAAASNTITVVDGYTISGTFNSVVVSGWNLIGKFTTGGADYYFADYSGDGVGGTADLVNHQTIGNVLVNGELTDTNRSSTALISGKTVSMASRTELLAVDTAAGTGVVPTGWVSANYATSTQSSYGLDYHDVVGVNNGAYSTNNYDGTTFYHALKVI